MLGSKRPTASPVAAEQEETGNLHRCRKPGARCPVVLSLEGDFAPHLVETLLSFAESTTAALASGAALA